MAEPKVSLKKGYDEESMMCKEGEQGCEVVHTWSEACVFFALQAPAHNILMLH